MFDTLISGGTVVNASGVALADIGIRDGRVAAILPPGETAMARTLVDASGRQLLPGLVDAHAHLRDPGLTHKETFESGTHAAALGGVTTILDMPTDNPWTATAQQLADKMALSSGRLNVDVGFQAVISKSCDDLDGLLALSPVSLELFTADVPADYRFDDLDAVTQVLRKLSGSPIMIGISPGDQSILEGSGLRNQDGGIRAFLESRPPLAEAAGIARAVLAAAEIGARVHVRQVNSKLGVETWRRLKDMADVSVETTPQNLFFTAGDYVTAGARLKGSPPFRGGDDVAALRQAVSDGLITVMATDHAPHSPAEKSARYSLFADIPGGMPGLQTLLAIMLQLVAEKLITLPDLVRMCSYNPAHRFGLARSKGAIAAGCDADILMVDMNGVSTIANADQVSLAAYTPFHEQKTAGRLTDVFLRGERIVRDGALIARLHGKIVRTAH